MVSSAAGGEPAARRSPGRLDAGGRAGAGAAWAGCSRPGAATALRAAQRRSRCCEASRARRPLQQLAHERQVLATLNHPHIARLLDGGTTPGGSPPGDGACARRASTSMWASAGLSLEKVLEAVPDGLRCRGPTPTGTSWCIATSSPATCWSTTRAAPSCWLDFGIAQLQGRGRQRAAGAHAALRQPEQRAARRANRGQRHLQPGPAAGRAAAPHARSAARRAQARAAGGDRLRHRRAAGSPLRRRRHAGGRAAPAAAPRKPLAALRQRRPYWPYAAPCAAVGPGRWPASAWWR